MQVSFEIFAFSRGTRRPSFPLRVPTGKHRASRMRDNHNHAAPHVVCIEGTVPTYENGQGYRSGYYSCLVHYQREHRCGIFSLDLLLFIAFVAFAITRYIMFHGVWDSMIRHPVQSLYLGCLPMSASILVSTGLGVVYQNWGFGGVTFLYVLWIFWWIIVILSSVCCFGLLYVMMNHHKYSMPTLTAHWLQPIVALIATSSTGQLIAAALMHYSMPHALLTMAISIIVLVIGMFLALMILVLYFHRLLLHGFPDVGGILSSFLPLVPCGHAGYSLLNAGRNFERVLEDELVGRLLYVVCLVCAFALWCIAVWWLLFAVIALVDTLACGKKIPFTLAYGSLVFPNGVHALLTIQLAYALDVRSFRILGAIYAAVVIVTWAILAGLTLSGDPSDDHGTGSQKNEK
ncbi:voltage-dependent anion channel-domain-containing protein [Gautieria morchelliformis]|nr:voltage-dependent anion channel-domain-containing protein [Gautieria morchelliformis]